MYVRGGARPLRLVADSWKPLTVLLVLAGLTEIIEPRVSHLELFSVVYVGVFSTALSIFLVFRFNEAYERWWEARTLWGGMINLSRDFARQVLTLTASDDDTDGRRLLVHRQIAFAHALRIRLREWDSQNGREQVEVELRRLLPGEADSLTRFQNIPNEILRRQSADVAERLAGSTGDRVLLARMDETLSRLHDVQGGCERIKTTTFPDAVTTITQILVWGLVVLLLIATVGPTGRGGVAATIAVCIMSMGYIWIESMGKDLKNPFENRPNDTPMTALSVTIERDLLEMMGETDLPPVVEPVNGVLM